MIAALASLLAPIPDGGSPPSEIVVLPPGPLIETRDGRAWLLDDPAAVAERSTAALAGQDAVVDYEHQSLHAPTNGRPAPAAGWISGFAVRDGAIVARVRWMDRAAKLLRRGEYRYVSPVFRHSRGERPRVLQIVNVALTNSPAMPDLPAVARRLIRKEGSMTLKEALAELGLDENADAKAVQAALAKWVPRTEFDAMAKRLESVETDTAAARAEAAVDQAVEDGKLTPASREWALAYATSDPDGFDRYLASAPVLLAAGEQVQPPLADGKPTADEQTICRAVGVSDEAFQKEAA